MRSRNQVLARVAASCLDSTSSETYGVAMAFAISAEGAVCKIKYKLLHLKNLGANDILIASLTA
jgi:hypothetical protein